MRFFHFFSYEKTEAETQTACTWGNCVQAFKIFGKNGPITKLLPITTSASV